MNKKILSLVLCICLFMFVFAGCSDEDTKKETEETTNEITSETSEKTEPEIERGTLKSFGIVPDDYVSLSAKMFDILGLDTKEDIYVYNVPQEAKVIYIEAYSFDGSGWKNVWDSGAGITAPSHMSGEISIEIKRDYSLKISGDYFRATTKPLTLSENIDDVTVLKLDDFWELELDKEVPVYMILADEDKKEFSYNLEDYPSTENLDGVDIAQILTIEFSSEPL